MNITNLKLEEKEKLVSEIDLVSHSRHTRYFILPLPKIGDKGFYRTTVSFNSFFNGGKRRNWNKKFLYHAMDSEDIDVWKGFYDKNTPLIKAKSLWDFYKLIGFDYKTNRYKQ